VTLFPALDRSHCAGALAISTGLRKIRNEDAGGWERYDRRSFYAVADSHFGPAAAVIAVQESLAYLSGRMLRKDHFEAERFRASFVEALARADERLYEAERGAGSETTLLVLAAGWGRVFWGSLGDSRLYAAGESTRWQLNRAEEWYLDGTGRDTSILSTRMVCGELRDVSERRQFSRLCLCTDGVPLARGTASEEWSTGDIGGILAAAPDPPSAAAELAAAALRRGGADNICAIVLDVPWRDEH
jgi:serine/threonine protein phosphatase PrpC